MRGGLDLDVVAALEVNSEEIETPLAFLDDPGVQVLQMPELEPHVELADPVDVRRPRRPADPRLHPAKAVAGDEPERRPVVVAEFAVGDVPRPDVVGKVEAETPRGQVVQGVVHRGVGVRVPDDERLQFHAIVAHEVAGVELEIDPGGVAIGRCRTVGGLRGGAARVDGADARLLEDRTLHPCDGEHLARYRHVRRGALDVIGMLRRADLVEPELVPACLAGQPRTVLNRYLLPGPQSDSS